MKSAIEAVLGGELANQNPDMGTEYRKAKGYKKESWDKFTVI